MANRQILNFKLKAIIIEANEVLSNDFGKINNDTKTWENTQTKYTPS